MPDKARTALPLSRRPSVLSPLPLPVDAANADVDVDVARGGIELIEQHREEWTALCHSEPFLRPDWVRAFVEAFAPHDTLVVLSARVDGHLAAVLPLIQRRRRFLGLPICVLESASNVHTCRFDMARDPGGAGLLAATALWDRLRAEPGWTALELRDIPEDGVLSTLVKSVSTEHPVGREESIASPIFALPDHEEDWSAWLSRRLSGKFRRELHRRHRQLEKAGTVRLRRIESADPRALAEFYELEASGWKGENGTAIDSHPQTRSYYDQIAAAAARAGYLNLYFLDLDGRPIAAHLALAYGGRYFTVKVAYSEQHSKYAPGHQIIQAVTRDLQGRGLSEFDFLGPTMDWKMHWARRTRPLQTLSVYRRSPIGRLMHLVRFGWKPTARRIAARLRLRDIGE